MAFDPSRLLTQLLNTGLQIKDNPLYQLLYQIINALSKLTTSTTGTGSSGSGGIGTLAGQTYITHANNVGVLPASRQLIAGNNISINLGIPGQAIISSTGGSGTGYWSPLTDGDIDETDFIFANGEAIMVFVPIP